MTNIFPVPNTPPTAVGDVYEWMNCRQMVLKLRKDDKGRDVAETFVVQPATSETWTKVQPLPFPPEAVLLCSIDSSAQSFKAGFEAAEESMRAILKGRGVNDEDTLSAIMAHLGITDEESPR